MLQKVVGDNRYARVTAGNLGPFSVRAGLDVALATPRPVQTCERPDLTDSPAFSLDEFMQRWG